MSPIRDTNLVVLTGDSVLSVANPGDTIVPTAGLEIEGTKLSGMALHLILPVAGGATPEMTVNVFGSSTSTITSASTYLLIASRAGLSAAGEYVIPFSTNKRTIAFTFVFTSASGNFSKAKAWVTLDYNQDWTRVPEWH